MPTIDPTFCQRKILDLHGASGARWLARLPELVAAYSGRWSLQVLPPFPVESYSYVAPAIRFGSQPVVLKLAPPNAELTFQAAALRDWDGSGICHLLEADEENGCLLMERLLPGDPLKTLPNDEQVTRIAVEVMQRLWKPAPEQPIFPTVAGWAGGFKRLRAQFGGGTGPLPAAQIERAERQFAGLLQDGASSSLLIHGDMNWGNILRAGRQPWLAIDPKGVIGDPLWDVATFLNDPPEGLTRPELRRLLSRRLAQISELLKVDRRLVKTWAHAHSVLSAFWTFEDHPGPSWRSAFERAELYDDDD